MEPADDLNLPAGFRFHPTDEELVVHYLARKTAARPFGRDIIADVHLYNFDPWELPAKAAFGEGEWYFFSRRDRKYPNGARPNRAAGSGYWKATGTDKPVLSGGTKVGVKKALVFYRGRAPKGVKTSWIMHEYRLAAPMSVAGKSRLRLDDWVLCRIYKKGVKASPVALPPPPAAETKLGADDQSCLEEALAWLPDIDGSSVPGMGSFATMLSGQPPQPWWSSGNGTEPVAVVINNRFPPMNRQLTNQYYFRDQQQQQPK